MDKAYVLITGATGFLGSRIAERILSERIYEVLAIVRQKDNYKNTEKLRASGAILIKGEFYDKKLLEETFAKFSVRFVIHCAAVRGGGRASSQSYQKVNVDGTRGLLEVSLARGVKKFVFCSSVGVFGTVPETLPAGLSTALKGDNAYHNSKILAEEEVKKFITRGLDCYIIRPTVTYGAGDNGFPLTLVNLVKKKMFWLPFRDVKIHLLDVESLVGLFSSILSVSRTSKRVFIAADKTPVSLKGLVDLIHRNYYGATYPGWLRMPDAFFQAALFLFRLTGNEKWATRVLLVSRSWYYDIKDTIAESSFVPSNTEEVFIKRMGI